MKPSEVVSRPVEEAVDLPDLESELDNQNPWPGLEGYDEGDAGFYKGRSEEIEKLYSLIRRERLTLLFGKAGTGKSSLVRAGLFPKQRREEALPVWVRLAYSEDAPPLSDQTKTAIYEAARAAKMEAPEPSEDQSLWEYLHLHRGEFWSQNHRIIMPFIVFDQFEELFTHGLVHQDPARVADIRKFISDLSDLAEDRVPAHVLTDRDRLDRHNVERHHFKLLVCVREESLAELDRMREDLPPALFHNRMRLTDLTEEQAKEIVEQTGKAVGADELSDEIVERASKDTQEQGRQTELGVPKSCVNPALLAVLCTTLNQKRLEDGAAKIAGSALESVGKNILTEFYERQLESLPEVPDEGRWPFRRPRSQVVNERIAEEFVDGDVRVSIPPSRARTLFGDAALAKLVADKVLGHTPTGRVELLHDVLSPTVGRTRTRFLEEWVERVRRWMPLLATAALIAAIAAFFIGREQGRRQAQPVIDDDRRTVNPQGPADGIGFAQAFVLDLNEGTRLVAETVGSLDRRDFQAAGVSLGDLGRFVEDRQPRFCGSVEPGSWREEEMSLVLGHACAAVGVQQEQRATLQRLVDGGEEVLTSDQIRSSTVQEWEDYEERFNAHRASINATLALWQAAFPPER